MTNTGDKSRKADNFKVMTAGKTPGNSTEPRSIDIEAVAVPGGKALDVEDGPDSLDYEQLKREHERIRAQNSEYLNIFERDLIAKGLSNKTIDRHLCNADLFINDYLLYYDTLDMEQGCYDVGGFLGDFFIRKCMWSTPSSIKTTAASLKKFYKCMLDHGFVQRESYDAMLKTIKNGMPEWQDYCKRFNDPKNYSNPFYDDLWLDDFDEEFDELGGPNDMPVLGNITMDDVDKMIADMFKEELGKLIHQKAEEAISQADDALTAPPSREHVIDMFTLMLFYLTSWEERIGGKSGYTEMRAWKSADWDALDRLREAGFISCSNKAKSVTINDAGARMAELTLASMGLNHLL